MEPSSKLKSFLRELNAAEAFLQEHAGRHPAISPVVRRLGRIARALNRPLRLAILGESNSGKSSIANLIVGETTLPALPVANTRLPTLLTSAPVPFVEALHENGQKIALAPGDDISLNNITRLDVGLPSETLRRLEILDFPGSANPLFKTDIGAVARHGVDAAIWATVATQAWRETERITWSNLSRRIRKRGILAVTHCDLISSEEDLGKLKARLRPIAAAEFAAICFIGAPRKGRGDSGDEATELIHETGRVLDQFESERIERGLTMTRRLAAKAILCMEPEVRPPVE